MNDHDLREMFRRRESDVTVQSPPPDLVVRRVRRRQILTVFVATMVAVALVALPIAGLRLLGDRSDRGPLPANTGPVELPPAADGLRVAALPYASIAYPDGWFLTDASPLLGDGTTQATATSAGLVLQLSGFDPQLHDAPLCVFDGKPIPNDGVLLTVGTQAAGDTSIPAPTADWPVDLAPYPPDTSPSCDQGVDLTVRWVAPSGVYYWANATIGADASQADRSALETAFASMLFPPTDAPWMSSFGADQGQGSPRLILDSTTFQGVPINLVAYLDHYKTLWLGLSAPAGSMFGGSALGVGSGSGPPPPIDNSMTSSASGTVVWGDASVDVVRAEIRTEDAQTLPATVLQIPENIGGHRNAVWGFVDAPTHAAQLVGYDAAGNLMGNPVISTAPPDVVASGTDPAGGAWTVSITHDTMGDGLTFAWGDGGGGGGCCLEDNHFEGKVLQLDGMNSGGNTPSVITAFASTQAASVIAKFPGGSFDAQLFPLPSKYLGPAQMVVVIVPASVTLKGELIAYDAGGTELARVPFDGGPVQEPGGATPPIDEAIQHLYTARDAAVKYYTDRGTFDPLELSGLGALAPSVTFDSSSRAVPHEVSVRVSASNKLAVVSTTEDGSVFCIGVEIDPVGGNSFYYGRVDSARFADCRGGWGPPPITG